MSQCYTSRKPHMIRVVSYDARELFQLTIRRADQASDQYKQKQSEFKQKWLQELVNIRRDMLKAGLNGRKVKTPLYAQISKREAQNAKHNAQIGDLLELVEG